MIKPLQKVTLKIFDKVINHWQKHVPFDVILVVGLTIIVIYLTWILNWLANCLLSEQNHLKIFLVCENTIGLDSQLFIFDFQHKIVLTFLRLH
jgi:hypothetical protein